MEIIIGSTPPMSQFGGKAVTRESGVVEAQLLHVRPPRKGIAGPSGAERRGKKVKDPLKGRVLTLMVSDAEALPRDIETAQYKVSLRFQKK